MTTLRVLTASRDFRGWAATRADAVVHSVFDRSINLSSDGRLWTLATRDVPAAPATAVLDLDDAHSLGLVPGDGFDLARLGDVEAVWEPVRPTGPANPHTVATVSALSAHLRPTTTGFDRAAQIRIDWLTADFRRAIATHDVPAAEAAAAGLLGLGPGLTPSGDDYLAGYALASRHFGKPDAAELIGRVVAAHAAERTNEISRCMLEHAVAGIAAHPLHHLLVTLTGDDRTAAEAAARDVIVIGHHSGHDLVSGVLAALEPTEGSR